MKTQFIRPKDDRIIGGVCAGLANYFNIDVMIIRLIFVILLLSGGAGVVVYIILLIIMPEEDDSSYAQKIKNESRRKGSENIKENIKETMSGIEKSVKSGKGNLCFALIVIILGIVLLVNNLFPSLSFYKIWPLIFVAIGVIMLLPNKGKDKNES